MSVRGTLGGILASAAVLIIGWQVGATALAQQTATTSGGAGSSGSGSSGTGSSASSSPSPSASASSSASGSSASPSTGSGLKDGGYTGSAIQTRYGVVQVAVTVSGGRITDVTTPVLDANDFRSQSINSQAVPILRREVLKAQSARVGMVSGATYTSEGYLTSLQAAIDKAK